jgi:hypothetical protein
MLKKMRQNPQHFQQINLKKNVLYYYKHIFISGNEDNNKLLIIIYP